MGKKMGETKLKNLNTEEETGGKLFHFVPI